MVGLTAGEASGSIVTTFEADDFTAHGKVMDAFFAGGGVEIMQAISGEDSPIASWQSSTAAIQRPELRGKSEARLKKSRERFAEIQTAGQGASDLYGPFMKTLQDQVTYLGHDLNPGAVSSLKPDADKLNASATELYAAIDKVTMAANNNINRLSSE